VTELSILNEPPSGNQLLNRIRAHTDLRAGRGEIDGAVVAGTEQGRAEMARLRAVGGAGLGSVIGLAARCNHPPAACQSGPKCTAWHSDGQLA